MRNFLGMTVKRITLQPCSTSGCRALTSNLFCKKCISIQESIRLNELVENTYKFGLKEAERIDRTLYGIGPIQPVTPPVGIIQN